MLIYFKMSIGYGDSRLRRSCSCQAITASVLFFLFLCAAIPSFCAINTGHGNLIVWNGNLVADFGANGMWYHDGTSWHWMTNDGDVGEMVVWDGKLVVDFGAGKGMYYYDGSWHWMTNNSDPKLMTAWDNGTTEVLVVDFGTSRRIYTYDGSWHWFSNKDGVADMTVWNDKLIVDFGSGRGMYNYDTAWHWMTNKDDVAMMLPWDNGTTEVLVVDFGGGRRMYTYNGAWNWFTNKDDVNDMAVWNGKLVVDFGAGRTLQYYDTSWHWMSNRDNVARMVALNDGGSEILVVDFGSGRNMYTYDGGWHWLKNANNLPETVAWNNRLAVDFGPATGLYDYDTAWHYLKSWSTYRPPAPVPDTGQDICYDSDGNILDPCPAPGQLFYGQDGAYTINPPSYTKMDADGKILNDDATQWAMVRDNITGLIWEARTDKNNIKNYNNPHDADNTYTWYDDNTETNGGHDGTPGDGTDTQDLLDSLNAVGFGGFYDWRLPTVKELINLAGYGTYNPAVNHIYFPNNMAYDYWTSTTSSEYADYAWIVYFGVGDGSIRDKSGAWYVRVVRGGKTQPDFTDNGDATVTDNITGLTWSQKTIDTNDDGFIDAADAVDWEEGLNWCENLSLAGHDDWRLPTIKELKSIVKDDADNPAVNTVYFPDTLVSQYWTSTSVYHSPGSAWFVGFQKGDCHYDLKTRKYFIRAVRGWQE